MGCPALVSDDYCCGRLMPRLVSEPQRARNHFGKDFGCPLQTPCAVASPPREMLLYRTHGIVRFLDSG